MTVRPEARIAAACATASSSCSPARKRSVSFEPAETAGLTTYSPCTGGTNVSPGDSQSVAMTGSPASSSVRR
jgi:hypothetical protein